MALKFTKKKYPYLLFLLGSYLHITGEITFVMFLGTVTLIISIDLIVRER